MGYPWKHTVVLASANIKYRLSTLMAAVDAAAPVGTCTELTLQVDPEFTGTYVYIGEIGLTTSDWGDKILATQVVTNRSRYNNVDVRNIYLMADAANALIGVSVTPG